MIPLAPIPAPNSTELPKIFDQLLQLEIEWDQWATQDQEPTTTQLMEQISLPLASSAFNEEISTILKPYIQEGLKEIRPKILRHISEALVQITRSIREYSQRHHLPENKVSSTLFEEIWGLALNLHCSRTSKHPTTEVIRKAKTKTWWIWSNEINPDNHSPPYSMDKDPPNTSHNPLQKPQNYLSTHTHGPQKAQFNSSTQLTTTLPHNHPYQNSPPTPPIPWPTLNNQNLPHGQNNIITYPRWTPSPTFTLNISRTPPGTPQTPLETPTQTHPQYQDYQEHTEGNILDLTNDHMDWTNNTTQPTPHSQKTPPLEDPPHCPQSPSRTIGDHHDPLSNFFPCHIPFRRKLYASSEHLYQALKATHLGYPQLSEQISQQPTALAAKQKADSLFHNSQLYNQALTSNPTIRILHQRWEAEGHLQVAWLSIQAKSKSCPIFSNQLRSSGSAYIAHNVLDPYWGTGSETSKIPHPMGLNILGVLLMRLRQTLLDKIPRTTSYTPQQQQSPLNNLRNQTTGTSYHPPPHQEACRDHNQGHHTTQDNSLPPLYTHTRPSNTMIAIAWELPTLNQPTTILGDGNLDRITSIQPSLNRDLAIHSYPGLTFKLLNSIVNLLEPTPQVNRIIIATGINDRHHNLMRTTFGTLTRLLPSIRRAYPLAQIFFAQIINPKLDPLGQSRMDKINKWFQRKGIKLLLQPPDLRFLSDGIHWTEDSANRLVDSWLHQLNHTPGH